MITIETDLYYIANRFNISAKRLSEYTNKSIEEIMEAEAANGNTEAAAFSKEILSNPVKLAKVFKLSSPGNRYAILQNLNEHDLEELLPLLEKDDLVMGLNFFTKDKLLKLMEDVPKDQMVKLALQIYSPEQLLQLMPDKELNNFLLSTDLDKEIILKHMKSLHPAILAKMIEAVTGNPVQSLNQQELLKQISQLPQDKFNDALIAIPPQAKKEYILQITKEKPELLQLFSNEAYVNLISIKEKPEIIKASNVLEPETLINMMKELPQDLLAVVMTQIDPDKFAAILIRDYKDILSQIIAA